MRKTWEEPRIIVQEFVANEYVAACGDENKVYNFKCDAKGGELYYYPQSDGKIDGVHVGSDPADRLGNYHPCAANHEARVTDDFYDGFVRHYYGPFGSFHYDTQVIVWRGSKNDNGHATENLTMNSWTTSKS